MKASVRQCMAESRHDKKNRARRNLSHSIHKRAGTGDAAWRRAALAPRLRRLEQASHGCRAGHPILRRALVRAHHAGHPGGRDARRARQGPLGRCAARLRGRIRPSDRRRSRGGLRRAAPRMGPLFRAGPGDLPAARPAAPRHLARRPGGFARTAGLLSRWGLLAVAFGQATWGTENAVASRYGARDSGLLFTSFGLLGSYDLSRRWLLVGSVELRQLYDAARESAVAEKSSGYYAMFGLAYRFPR